MGRIFLAGLIVLYGCTFAGTEQGGLARKASLEFALPVTFHRVVAGYLRELAAEMLFVKSSIFLGGLKPGTPPTSYVDALGHNFDVMTKLYPNFIDPYFFCHAFLPPISVEAASTASKIFETGIAVRPNDFILRFFYGTNFFLAMNEPLSGAKAFADAATIPGAPPIFAHLAALLSAQGGDIAAGLISLKAMLIAEKDEMIRARYRKEIIIFEQAMIVQKALNAYAEKYGIPVPPKNLEELVPEFLPQIPDIKGSFVLVYNPPFLSLQRPEIKRSHPSN